MMRRTFAYLLCWALAFAPQTHAQLALTHGGKALAGGGGGGGGGAITTDAVSKAGGVATDLTGNSVTPNGTNRAAFGVTVSCGAFDTTEMRYGGSGGTTLTQIGTDTTAFFGNFIATMWGAAGSPNTSTTGYSLLTGSGEAAMVVEFIENVNQTTPFSAGTFTSASGDGFSGTTFTATATVTGLTSGDEIRCGMSATTIGTVGITSFTVVAGTEVDRQLSPGGSGNGQTGVMILRATAAGTTATATVDVVQSGSDSYGWTMACVRINP